MTFSSSALFALVLNCSSPFFCVSEHLPVHTTPGACAGHCQRCWHGHQSPVPLSEGSWLPINLSSRWAPAQHCINMAMLLRERRVPAPRAALLLPGAPGLPVCAQAAFPPTSPLLFTEGIAVSCCFRWSCLSSLDSCPPCWHPVAFEPHQLESLVAFAPCCSVSLFCRGSQRTWFRKEFLAFPRVFIYRFFSLWGSARVAKARDCSNQIK